MDVTTTASVSDYEQPRDDALTETASVGPEINFTENAMANYYQEEEEEQQQQQYQDDAASDSWEINSDASFTRKYDVLTDAVQVFPYSKKKTDSTVARPSRQADRRDLGSKLQQVKNYYNAVGRLSLWYERDELARKSKLAANRILFCTTYMNCCVQCYRKSIKIAFVSRWKLATENSRCALDNLFTTPVPAGTPREGLVFCLYDHIYVHRGFRRWKGLWDLFGRGAKAMVKAENRIFRATLFRRWKLVMQVFHALDRVSNDWLYSRQLAAVRQWRGTSVDFVSRFRFCRLPFFYNNNNNNNKIIIIIIMQVS